METKTATNSTAGFSPAAIKWSVGLALLAAVVVVAGMTRQQWLPQATSLWSPAGEKPHAEDHADPHAGHDPGHAGHDDATSLELSPQARKNIGLKTAAIELTEFVRTVSMPAIVVGRPGRSEVDVTATLGGRVTRVYPIEGEAVEPGQKLFELRLTHEELVQAQSELLRLAEQLDVERREIERLGSIVDSGVIPGKRLLEREYEKQKIEAGLNAQRQSLLLHGLSEEQVNTIIQMRTLVQQVTVVAPDHPEIGSEREPQPPYTVRSLGVKPGQYVDTGASLCILMDYSELYIQGRAFEHDADELVEAAREAWNIRAVPEDKGSQQRAIDNLHVVYVDNEVEPLSRALHFYVRLPNEVVNESKTADGHRFLTWRYKPGQRMQLQVPVERWPERIVLPIDAVANEGVESYVFQQNGNHFDRVPVQVEYSDQFNVVIANDGSIFPGDIVALSGAHQLQMALKNKSGGGVDPHAGHNH